MKKLIIVANRNIIDFHKKELEEKLFSKFTAGGLAQGMVGILKKESDYSPMWIGASVGDADEEVLSGEYNDLFKEFKEKGISPNSYPEVICLGHNTVEINYRDYWFLEKKIHLPSVVMDGYYNEFSNSFLWGLMHNTQRLLHKELKEFPEPKYHTTHLEYYLAANAIFAATISEVLRMDNKKKGIEDIIWLQDYHIMRTPMILRDELNQLKKENRLQNIKYNFGQFMHIPFPDTVKVLSDFFNEHENYKETFVLLSFSLLGNEFVGFHIPSYCENFANTIEHYADYFPKFFAGKKLLKVIKEVEGHFKIEYDDNGNKSTTIVGAYPIGVDPRRILKEVTPDKRLEFKRDDIDLCNLIERDKKQGKAVFGGIDRYDFTKGIPRKLQIFEEYLKLGRNARLIQMSEPTREKSEVYKNLRSIVHEIVENINVAYRGGLGYDPVVLRRESLGFENYRFMRDVDVLMITPEEDGMNIVVYEGILSKKYKPSEDRGIIVLGRCGASKVLEKFGEEDGILRVDQLNPREAAHKIKQVMEGKYRVSDLLIDYVEKHCNVAEWARKNIHTIRTGEYLGFRQV